MKFTAKTKTELSITDSTEKLKLLSNTNILCAILDFLICCKTMLFVICMIMLLVLKLGWDLTDAKTAVVIKWKIW